MAEFNARVAGGEQVSFEGAVGESPLFLGVEGSDTPYTVDVESKRFGAPDSKYSRIEPFVDLGTETVQTTGEVTFETNRVDYWVRVTITNDSSGPLDVNGVVNGSGQDDYYVKNGTTFTRPSVESESVSTDGLNNALFASKHADGGSGTTSDPYKNGVANAIAKAESKGWGYVTVLMDGHCETQPGAAPITSDNVAITIQGWTGQYEIFLADGVDADHVHITNRGVQLRNVMFEGNKANQSQTSNGVVFKQDKNNQDWVNVEIDDYNGYGLLADGATSHAMDVTGLYVELCRDGNIGAINGGKFTESSFTNGWVYAAGKDRQGNVIKSGSHGIHSTDSGLEQISGEFTNFWVVTNSGDGIHTLQGTPEFTNCVFKQNDNRGVYSEANRTKIVGGRSLENGATGVMLKGDYSHVGSGFVSHEDNQSGGGTGRGVSVKGPYSTVSDVVVEASQTTLSEAFDIGGVATVATNVQDRHEHGIYSRGGNAVNGRFIPATIDLGGADGSLQPGPVAPVEEVVLHVDAGGSAVNVPAIDDIDQASRECLVVRKGGENVTLQHNTAGTGSVLLLDGAADVTLSSSGDMVCFHQDDGPWREKWRHIQ